MKKVVIFSLMFSLMAGSFTISAMEDKESVKKTFSGRALGIVDCLLTLPVIGIRPSLILKDPRLALKTAGSALVDTLETIALPVTGPNLRPRLAYLKKTYSRSFGRQKSDSSEFKFDIEDTADAFATSSSSSSSSSSFQPSKPDSTESTFKEEDESDMSVPASDSLKQDAPKPSFFSSLFGCFKRKSHIGSKRSRGGDFYTSDQRDKFADADITYSLDDYKKLKNKEKNLVRANLKGADLRFFDLRGVDFTDADLSGANLSGLDKKNMKLLHGTIFDRTNLKGANLSYTRLENCSFNETVLIRTKLIGSYLFRCIINKAAFICSILNGATFSNMNIRETIFFKINDASGINIENIVSRDSCFLSVNMKNAIINGFFLNSTILADVDLNNSDIKNICIKNNGILGVKINFANARIYMGYILGKVVDSLSSALNAKSTYIYDDFEKALSGNIRRIKEICLKYNFHETFDGSDLLKKDNTESIGLSKRFDFAMGAAAIATDWDFIYSFIPNNSKNISSILKECNFYNANLNSVYFSNVTFDKGDSLKDSADLIGAIFENTTFNPEKSIESDIANYVKSIGAKVVIKHGFIGSISNSLFGSQQYAPEHAQFWSDNSNLGKEIAKALIIRFATGS